MRLSSFKATFPIDCSKDAPVAEKGSMLASGASDATSLPLRAVRRLASRAVSRIRHSTLRSARTARSQFHARSKSVAGMESTGLIRPFISFNPLEELDMAGTTATTSTTAGAGQTYEQIVQDMKTAQQQQAAFNLQTQQISAAMTASSAATNLITSGHQAAGNAAKSIGQNMVDSSRR